MRWLQLLLLLLLVAALAAPRAVATIGPPPIDGTMTAPDTLATGASALDDTYNGWTVSVVGGAGAGQTEVVTDYTGANRVVQPANGFNPATDSTSVYTATKPGRPAAITGVMAQVPQNSQNFLTGGTCVRSEASKLFDSGHPAGYENGVTSCTNYQSGCQDGTLGPLGCAWDNNACVDGCTSVADPTAGTCLNSDGCTYTQVLSSVNDAYNKWNLLITAGPGAGQSRSIQGYTAGPKIANVAGEGFTGVDATSTYALSWPTYTGAEFVQLGTLDECAGPKAAYQFEQLDDSDVPLLACCGGWGGDAGDCGRVCMAMADFDGDSRVDRVGLCAQCLGRL